MPRELVHFHVLAASLTRLPKESLIKQHISENVHHALLGAMLHDAPLYAPSQLPKAFMDLSDVLHGGWGQDPFEAVRAICAEIRRTGIVTPQINAVIAGMLSHMVVDATFHPLVVYLTGSWYQTDPAKTLESRYNHRLFETRLDMCFDRSVLPNRGFYDRSLEKVGDELVKICKLLAASCRGENFGISQHSVEEASHFWNVSIKRMAQMKRLFLNPCAALAYRASRIFKPGVSEYLGLFPFWAGKFDAAKLKNQKLHYLNPVTGQEYHQSPQELFDLAVNECTQLLLDFENFVNSNFNPTESFNQRSFRSLETGAPGARWEQVKFVSNDTSL